VNRFEEMLRTYMALKGISQRELARQLDMSPATVNRIVHGKNFEVRHLFKLVMWLMEPEGPEREEAARD